MTLPVVLAPEAHTTSHVTSATSDQEYPAAGPTDFASTVPDASAGYGEFRLDLLRMR